MTTRRFLRRGPWTVLAALAVASALSIVSADHQIMDVTLTAVDPAIAEDPLTVAPGAALDLAVTVETDGNVPPVQNEWSSTAWGFSPSAVNSAANCVPLPAPIPGGAPQVFTHALTVMAPGQAGEFELLLKISGTDACGGGQASGVQRTGALVMVVDEPENSPPVAHDDTAVTPQRYSSRDRRPRERHRRGRHRRGRHRRGRQRRRDDSGSDRRPRARCNDR